MPLIVLGIVGTFGAQDAVAYFVARRGLRGPDALRILRRIVAPACVITALLALGLAEVLFRGRGALFVSFLWLFIAIPVQVAFNMLIGLATGEGNVGGLNAAKILPPLLRALVVIGFVATIGISPAVAAAVLLLSPLIGITWLLARRAPERSAPSTVAPTDRQFVSFALAAFPGVLAGVSTARLDQVIGLPLVGAHQLGLYAVAVSVAELPMVVPTAARAALLGMRGHARVLEQQLRLTVRVTAATGFFCALMGGAMALLLRVVFGAGFAAALVPCLLLLAATVVYSVGTCTSAILLSMGRARSQSRALVVGTCVSVAMLVSLRHHGAFGMAVASLVGYTATALMCAVDLRLASLRESAEVGSTALSRANSSLGLGESA